MENPVSKQYRLDLGLRCLPMTFYGFLSKNGLKVSRVTKGEKKHLSWVRDVDEYRCIRPLR